MAHPQEARISELSRPSRVDLLAIADKVKVTSRVLLYSRSVRIYAGYGIGGLPTDPRPPPEAIIRLVLIQYTIQYRTIHNTGRCPSYYATLVEGGSR